MKCMQCEESVAGTGCVRNGVCGKSGELSDAQDRLIGTLMELSAASSGCEDKGLMASLDEHIVDSLFMTLSNTNFDMGRIEAACDASRELMGRLGRSCDMCMSADRGFSIDAYDANEDIRSLKLLLLYGLKGLAAYYHHAYVLGARDQSITSFIRKGLASIRDPLSLEQAVDLNMECGEYGAKAMALLDEYNTKLYGKPEITKVRTSVRGNPGILIL